MSKRQQATARRPSARRSPNGRRKQLSEDEIVEAALALARRVGIRAVTMRGLAEELGVTPMAAYYYVPNKQALIDVVANTVLARARMPGPEAGSWEERLWGFISQNIRELAKYPGLGEYLETSRLTAAGKRQVEESVAVLEEAGFSSEDARKAYSAIYAYMYGRVMFQSMRNHEGRPRPRRQRRPRGALSLAELASEDHIEFGYRALAAGIRALLR